MASRWSKRLPVSEFQLSDIIVGLWTAASHKWKIEGYTRGILNVAPNML